jgi:acyl dehydratase
MAEALLFDDLSVGNQWTSAPRTVSEADVAHFADLTGDYSPLHLDERFAKETPFRQPIVHGLLGLSLVGGMGSDSPQVETLALLAIRDWQFVKPVFFEDQLHVVTEVVALQVAGRRRGRVVWRRSLVNQHGVTVQQGIFETLVSRVRVQAEQSLDDAMAQDQSISTAVLD